MIIELPENFVYTSGNNEGQAYAIDNVLYVYGNVDIEGLMYTLTYALKGYNRCYYCRRKINHSRLTLDHVYPRAWGGVSVPENLIPCCKKCNNEKSDMTLKQYSKWKRLKNRSQKEQYWQKARIKNESILRKGKLIIPCKWMEEYDITSLVAHINFENIPLNNKGKITNFYKNYHMYPRPIIVSKNGWCFKGLHILRHAKKNGITKVQAIVLENVIKC